MGTEELSPPREQRGENATALSGAVCVRKSCGGERGLRWGARVYLPYVYLNRDRGESASSVLGACIVVGFSAGMSLRGLALKLGPLCCCKLR